MTQEQVTNGWMDRYMCQWMSSLLSFYFLQLLISSMNTECLLGRFWWKTKRCPWAMLRRSFLGAEPWLTAQMHHLGFLTPLVFMDMGSVLDVPNLTGNPFH